MVGEQVKVVAEWWMRLCTGRNHDDKALDEESYRERVLVMASGLWIAAGSVFCVIVNIVVDLSPEGRLSANLLFAALILGMLGSMVLLRASGSRLAAVNVVLLVFGGGLASSCFIFGGTSSPTYLLLMMVPLMGSIAGNVRTAVSWGIIVVMFWIAVMLAERQGVVFHSIIRPENYSMAMLMSLTGISCAVVAIMVSYVEMNRALRDDLQVTNAELEHLSFHDKLTGLPNRRFYDERFTTVLQRSAQQDTRTGLLFIDINKFKQINDTYGHALGDKILIAVSQRLQRALRESDLIARLGGDEFVAVLEEVHSADELTGIALKLTQAIDQPVTFRQHSIDVRTSIGIAMFPQDGRQKHELEEQADRAMYYAKKRGIPYALSGLEARNSPYPTKYRQDV